MGIEKFQFCTKDGLFFEPNITGNVNESLFENIDDLSYRRYSNSTETGVAWLNAGVKVTLLEKGIRIFGLPSPNHEKAILIFPREHTNFKFPKNAVIYDPDGKIHLQLKEPVLVSKILKERKKNYESPDRLWYDQVFWRNDSTSSPVVVMKIGFCRDWYENRVLNVDTGELGELISSGKF